MNKKDKFIEDNLNKKEYKDLFPQVIGRRNYLGALYDIQEKAKKKVEIVENAEKESEDNVRRRENDSETSAEAETS
jgi:hypothetical protein